MKYDAIWLLNIDDADGLNGSLEIDDFGDAHLSLPQGFGKEIEQLTELSSYDWIYGTTNHGDFILLECCKEISTNLGRDTIIVPERVLVFKNKDGYIAGFNKMIVSFDRLGVWLGDSSVSVQYDRQENRACATASPKSIWEGEFENISYKFRCDLNINNNLFNEFSIKSKYYLEIIFLETRLFGNIQLKSSLSLVYKICDLLCMLVGEDVYINSVKLEGEGNSTILYQHGFTGESHNKKDKSNQSIDFKLIINDFTNILTLWIQKYENLLGSAKVVRNYYLDTGKRRRIIDIPTLIKDVCVGIESYSRNIRQIKIEEDEECYQKKVNRIYNACKENTNDVTWLKAKLRYANEASLRKRLKIIFGELSNDYPDVKKYLCLDDKKKLDILIDRIVKTRNFYTHYDLSMEDTIYSDSEAYNVSILLIEVLRLIVLQESGVDKNTLNQIWKENQIVLKCCEDMGFIELIPMAIVSILPEISTGFYNLKTSYFKEKKITYDGVLRLLSQHDISHFITIDKYEKTQYGFYDDEETIKRICAKFDKANEEKSLQKLKSIIEEIHIKDSTHKIAIWASPDYMYVIELLKIYYDKIIKG